MANARDLYRAGIMSAERWGKQSKKMKVEKAYAETIKDPKGQEQVKIVLEFEDGQIRVALNKTNADHMIKAFGEETDDWEGQYVTISTAKTQFGGKAKDGLVLTPHTKK